MTERPFFTVDAELPGRRGRTGVIHTPHGDIDTPAFVAVGTKATVKAVLPETMHELGAQAVLANAYHLYLQPGPDIVDEAGGLGAFMNWPGPTFTDSGGFQVLSLGVGFSKVLSMDADRVQADDIIAEGKQRLAHVDDDGVTFSSHLDGSTHRFTPEVSMQIQHQLGADIIFAFDELTTLVNTRGYQEESVQRTHAWAVRCLAEHRRLTAGAARPAVAGVVRRGAGRAVRGPAAAGGAGSGRASSTPTGAGFDGYGIGGALEKQNLATIVGWVHRRAARRQAAAPAGHQRARRPVRRDRGRRRHLRLRVPVAGGAQRRGVLGRPAGTTSPPRATGATSRRSTPNATATPARTTPGPTCTTCSRPRRCWPRRCARSTTSASSIRLVDQIRAAITAGEFDELREHVLGRYYSTRAQ